MKMYIGGQWVDRDEKVPVINPYSGSQVDTVPRGSAADVDAAVTSAVAGAAVMADVPAYQRYTILKKAADLLAERTQEFARTITMEEGKTLAEATAEVGRAVQTMTLSGRGVQASPRRKRCPSTPPPGLAPISLGSPSGSPAAW